MSAVDTVIPFPKVCCTCLSSDRVLFSGAQLFSACRGFEMNTKATDVCWECRAVLHKMVGFQRRALEANKALTLYLKNSTKFSSLSTLSKTKFNICTIISMDDDAHRNMLEGNLEWEQSYKQEALNPDVKKENTENNNVMTEQIDKNNERIKTEAVEKENEIVSSLDLSIEESCDINSDLNIAATEQRKETKDVRSNKKKDDVKVKYGIKVISEEELQSYRRIWMDKVKGPHRCERCVLGFRSDVSFLEHNVLRHNNQLQYTCDICKCSFSLLSKLRTHIRSHYRVYRCLVCQYITRTRSMVRKHCSAKHERGCVYKCRKCSQVFLTETDMVSHRGAEHDVISCHVCGKKLKERRSLRNHMLLHTGMPMFECPTCHRSYRGEWGLRNHMVSHRSFDSEAAYCAECNLQCRTIYIYRQHLKYSAKHVGPDRFPCSQCDGTYRSAKTLRRHVKLHHEKQSKHVCHICNKLFSGQQKLQTHVRHVHEKLPKPKIFDCHICEKKFSAKAILQSHLNCHTGERPFKCDVCRARFRQSGSLHRHKQFLHCPSNNKLKLKKKLTETE